MPDYEGQDPQLVRLRTTEGFRWPGGAVAGKAGSTRTLALLPLRHVHRRVQDALRGHPDGPLWRGVVLAAGITTETATDGRVLTWDRKVDPGLRPDMTMAQRRGGGHGGA